MSVLDNVIDLFELAKERADELLTILVELAQFAYDIALIAATGIAQTTGVFAGQPEYLLYSGLIVAAVLWKL